MSTENPLLDLVNSTSPSPSLHPIPTESDSDESFRPTLRLLPIGRQPSFNRLSEAQLITKSGVTISQYEAVCSTDESSDDSPETASHRPLPTKAATSMIVSVPASVPIGLRVQSSYYRFMKPSNATAPSLPLLADPGPPPRIVPIAEGKSAWMSSLRDLIASRWRELGYDPVDPDGKPVWAGLPVVTDTLIEADEDLRDDDGVIKLLIDDNKNPNVRLALQGGSLAGCDEENFQRTMVELQRIHKECLERGSPGDAARVRNVIDNVKAERRKEDRGSVLAMEESAALEECHARFHAEFARVEGEWANERKQAAFRKPSAALLAMRKAAERLIAAKTYDQESGLARQIAEREAEEKRMADEKSAEAKDVELAALKAEYEAARGAILTDFERRRRAKRKLGNIAGGGIGRPRVIMGQPEIVRPLSSVKKDDL
jgi:hypothetical protein